MSARTVENACGRTVDTPTVATKASATVELTKILTSRLPTPDERGSRPPPG